MKTPSLFGCHTVSHVNDDNGEIPRAYERSIESSNGRLSRCFFATTGWSTKKTPAGELYYVNHKDKTTSWERPMVVPQATSLPAEVAVPREYVAQQPWSPAESVFFPPLLALCATSLYRGGVRLCS